VFLRNALKFYTGSSKKMDGIWNRYNLKSTRRIYTCGVLKCSETFKVLDLPQYISICAPFVALETSKRNSISCHVFWIVSCVTVSMADVIKTERQWRICSKVTPSPARARDSPPAWTSPQRLKVTQLKFPCQWRAPPLFKWSLILQ